MKDTAEGVQWTTVPVCSTGDAAVLHFLGNLHCIILPFIPRHNSDLKVAILGVFFDEKCRVGLACLSSAATPLWIWISLFLYLLHL